MMSVINQMLGNGTKNLRMAVFELDRRFLCTCKILRLLRKAEECILYESCKCSIRKLRSVFISGRWRLDYLLPMFDAR